MCNYVYSGGTGQKVSTGEELNFGLPSAISWYFMTSVMTSVMKSWRLQSGFNFAKYCTLRLDKWKNKVPTPSFIADLCERCSKFHWHPCVVSLPGLFSSAFSFEKLVSSQRWVAPLIHVVHGVFSILHDVYSPQNSRITNKIFSPLIFVLL